jgi:hypothetical protein
MEGESSCLMTSALSFGKIGSIFLISSPSVSERLQICLKHSQLKFKTVKVIICTSKTLSKELFAETCIKKQICDEKDAKFIYVYSYEN